MIPPEWPVGKLPVYVVYSPLRTLQIYGPTAYWPSSEICTQGHLEVRAELGMEAHTLNLCTWNVLEEGIQVHLNDGKSCLKTSQCWACS